ncbi:DUF5412 family protein [Bacillus licheniformis]|nr:DUF5412 family protein [Bacillus licheniformis]
MNHLPKGNWFQSSGSPNQAYNLNLYRVNKGGGTNSPSVRGELTTVATGERKNIYWGYEEEHAKSNGRTNTMCPSTTMCWTSELIYMMEEESDGVTLFSCTYHLGRRLKMRFFSNGKEVQLMHRPRARRIK